MVRAGSHFYLCTFKLFFVVGSADFTRYGLRLGQGFIWRPFQRPLNLALIPGRQGSTWNEVCLCRLARFKVPEENKGHFAICAVAETGRVRSGSFSCETKFLCEFFGSRAFSQ